jgi:CIC family chloride channel protein
MAAIVLATGTSNLLSNDTIYTLKLRRRGIDLDERPSAHALTAIHVREAMQAVTVTVPGDVSLAAAATMVERAPLGLAAVVDHDGTYVGVLTAQTLADALADGEHDDASASSIAEPLVAITTDDTLDAALDVLDNAHGPGVPVIDAHAAGVVGWLTPSDVLRAMRPSRSVVSGSVPSR